MIKLSHKPLEQNRKAGILLDTNILLLLFVGMFKKEQITEFKRTRQFTLEDYDTLVRIIGNFDKIVTTTNILTEVSNHLGYQKEHLRPSQFEVFAYGIALLEEHHFPSMEIACMGEFKLFGLTDAAILRLCQTKCLVLTDDGALCNYLQKQGVYAENFNHIRVRYWQ